VSSWFLVRSFDKGRWIDGLFFAAGAAVLWRVHLIYWPFYAIFAAYAVWRLVERKTALTWRAAALVFALAGIALVPVALRALALDREAGAHVIVPRPKLRDLRNSYHFNLAFICGAGAWLIGRIRRWPIDSRALSSSPALVLIAGWWLWHPLVLLAVAAAILFLGTHGGR